MERNEYNGWTNYETWNAALWMDNDQYQYARYRELATELLEYHGGYREDALYALAEAMQQDFDANLPDTTGVYMDILNAAAREIDWQDIAEHYIDEAVIRCRSRRRPKPLRKNKT
jgi:hypothetical protein